MTTKLKIGMFSLTSCEGCYFAVLDLREQFFKLADKVELKNFRLTEEHESFLGEKYDIALVEGSPLTSANMEELKRIRKNSRWLIAFGTCAHLGGIYHLKEYHDKAKIFDHVYHDAKGLDNLACRPLSEYVKVDYVIPGCPITGAEFLNIMKSLLAGKSPNIPQRPVCYECQARGYECLLQKGELCFGPIIQGGCEAVCLKSKQGCWGCRGLVKDAAVENLLKLLRKKHSDREIVRALEVFGIKEQV